MPARAQLRVLSAAILISLAPFVAPVTSAQAAQCNLKDANRIQAMANAMARPAQRCEADADRFSRGELSLASACRSCRAAQKAFRSFSRFSKNFERACRRLGDSEQLVEMRRLIAQVDVSIAPLSRVLKDYCR